MSTTPYDAPLTPTSPPDHPGWNRSVTMRMLDNLLDALAQGIRQGLGARVKALEARIVELEARPKGLTYGGIWGEGEAHAKDTLVTRSGCLWIAERDTTQQPGSPDSGWKMITKKGSIPDDHR